MEGAPASTEASTASLLEANQPCAVSAGAEAAHHGWFDKSQNQTKNEPFRVCNAYFNLFIFSYSSKKHVSLEGTKIKFRKTPTFLFSPNGQKSVIDLMSSKLEGLRISAAEVFDTFSVFHAKQN